MEKKKIIPIIAIISILIITIPLFFQERDWAKIELQNRIRNIERIEKYVQEYEQKYGEKLNISGLLNDAGLRKGKNGFVVTEPSPIYEISPEPECEEVINIINSKNIYDISCEVIQSKNFNKKACRCDLYYKRGMENGTRYLSHVKADIFLKERIVIWQGMMIE